MSGKIENFVISPITLFIRRGFTFRRVSPRVWQWRHEDGVSTGSIVLSDNGSSWGWNTYQSNGDRWARGYDYDDGDIAADDCAAQMQRIGFQPQYGWSDEVRTS